MNLGVNVPLQDPLQNGFMGSDAAVSSSCYIFDITTNVPKFNFPMEFPSDANNTDVLQDFDFDSFLHNDGDNDNFNFDTSGFLDDGNQIGAE